MAITSIVSVQQAIQPVVAAPFDVDEEYADVNNDRYTVDFTTFEDHVACLEKQRNANRNTNRLPQTDGEQSWVIPALGMLLFYQQVLINDGESQYMP